MRPPLKSFLIKAHEECFSQFETVRRDVRTQDIVQGSLPHAIDVVTGGLLDVFELHQLSRYVVLEEPPAVQQRVKTVSNEPIEVGHDRPAANFPKRERAEHRSAIDLHFAATQLVRTPQGEINHQQRGIREAVLDDVVVQALRDFRTLPTEFVLALPTIRGQFAQTTPNGEGDTRDSRDPGPLLRGGDSSNATR